jgi:hypothetical protein
MGQMGQLEESGNSATGGNPLLEITEQRLRAAMVRAMRLAAIMALVLAAVLLVTAKWQSAVLALVGAAVSASGLWEWQKLVTVISAKMENERKGGGTRVIVGFFVRLLLAAAILYASLKCFHGSIFALLGGLAVAVLALAFEAVRLVRS